MLQWVSKILRILMWNVILSIIGANRTTRTLRPSVSGLFVPLNIHRTNPITTLISFECENLCRCFIMYKANGSVWVKPKDLPTDRPSYVIGSIFTKFYKHRIYAAIYEEHHTKITKQPKPVYVSKTPLFYRQNSEK